MPLPDRPMTVEEMDSAIRRLSGRVTIVDSRLNDRITQLDERIKELKEELENHQRELHGLG